MTSARQKILIVDDNPINLTALEGTLEELGVETVRAESGNDALKATLHHDFALCILDVQMPEMTGYELAEFLKKDTKTKFVPIIFLTAALMEPEEMIRGYEVGAVEYVVKPYDPFVLLSKARVFLQLDEQRRQLETLVHELESKDRLIEQQAKAIEIGQHEKLSALGRLTASVTHELNQPLNAIRIICGDIRRDLRKERFDFDTLEESMSDVCGQIDRMAKITDHLRIYSRRVGQSEERPMAARDPVDGALGLLRHQMRIDGIEVSVELTEGLQIVGDQLKLEQVLVNLLSNASDAAKLSDAERPPWVGIRVYAETDPASGQERIVFAVSDSGPGVAEPEREEIFQPFFTGKRRGEGTGLGLSVSKQIAESHGGTLELEQSGPEGTTFRMSLPAPTGSRPTAPPP